MTTEVATVSPETPLSEVAALMSMKRYSCMVVVEQDYPIAVITERDMTKLASQLLNGEPKMTLRDMMSPSLVSLSVEASCSEALELANSKGIRRMIILDNDGKLAGVATQSDLLRAHTEDLSFQKENLESMVKERTQELRGVNKRLMELTRIDPMLEIGNRRSMDEELIKISERARRYKRPFAIALVDVDNFKKYNDHYGHRLGDEALIQVASALQNSVRSADSVYRYGGEEFLVILPEIGIDGAVVAGEHMRAAIEALNIEHVFSKNSILTASFGIAEEYVNSPCIEGIINRADTALYAAKTNGRNQVCTDSALPDLERAV